MSKLLPYETIVKACEGDLEAVNAVLLHYAGYIRYFSKVNGQVNAEVEDYVKQRLIDCQFKFRLDEPPDNP
ncbi:MAG: helix-turn-helix domain-containing protein [Pseudoflavonifractor capillosus]|uniref:helix-turn-helix domain-containing protein n=1 Tax=Pseudoflavonifractor capillosus TaxID=106588 RepID=UPI0023FA2991|nr:helix-turn-helix domain-containing protein [Pseudoflavonifractor capillosus]MCI5927412.1 helix-turn-helix domain-containing protein [Pseudoflavonifractor capillosus]MDY4660585.1 helix-turn-helix domain-containing protein [Pseudoflavonifractor capillosus]